MKSTPIKKISMADMVCTELQHRIKDGEWAIGEKLPAEIDLAALFGVNRLTVRMALQKLNTLGIVETKTGSGTFVVDFDFASHIKEVSDFYMEPELLNDVHEFRNIVELDCVKLACQRRTEEELDELSLLLQAYENLLAEYSIDPLLVPWKQCAKADLAFHRQIVKMAHNKLLEYAFTVAQQSIYQYIIILNRKRMLDMHVNLSPNGFETVHQDIFDGIKHRDEAKSCSAHIRMISHEV